MPDTRFSWRALREHLRKTLWIYLLGIALCLVGTSLLWTMTRPQYRNDEVVTVCLVDSFSNPDPLAGIARHMLEETRPFDDALKQVQFESLMYNAEVYTSQMLLVTRLSVGEGDAFLASQAGMDALAASEALVPLEEYVARGWPGGWDLEPYYVTQEDEDTGESRTWLAGLRLDDVDRLMELGAFNNEGAYLCVAANGGNVETTMKALETMLSDLMEANDAGTEAA